MIKAMFLCKKAIPLQICIKDNFSIRCYSINNLLKSAKKDKASSYLMRSDSRFSSKFYQQAIRRRFVLSASKITILLFGYRHSDRRVTGKMRVTGVLPEGFCG